jgi:hypothetical protein
MKQNRPATHRLTDRRAERAIRHAGRPTPACEPDFDWSDRDAVLIGDANRDLLQHGRRHIRQERRDYEDEKPVILILPDIIDLVIKWLTAIRHGAER